MKYRTILRLSLFILTASSQAAESLCQQKERDIQHEINIARQHDNQRRVNGLERALTDTRASCTNEKLKSQQQEKIKEHQKRVGGRQKDLGRDKTDSDDGKKIARREEKLAEAKRELKAVQSAPY